MFVFHLSVFDVVFVAAAAVAGCCTNKNKRAHTRTCGHFIDFSHTHTRSQIGKKKGEINEATMRIRKSIRPKMQ